MGGPRFSLLQRELTRHMFIVTLVAVVSYSQCSETYHQGFCLWHIAGGGSPVCPDISLKALRIH